MMRKSLVLMSAVVLMGIAATSVSGDCMLGDFDLSPIGVVQLNMEQDYQGTSEMHTWVVSLCGPVSVPPNAATECKAQISGNVLPGYVTEYSTTICETSWGKLTGSSVGYNTASLFLGETDDSNHPLWTANIYLSCGTSVALTPVGNVNVTGTNVAALNFDFHFTTSQVCSPPPTPSPPTPPPPATQCIVAGYDLSQLPVVPLQINQLYNGGNTMYTWTIDLCTAISVPPASQPPCTVPGYISEYSDVCETAW
ncbi:Hypothetical protein, putative, partial [Bodo saltans]